MTIKYVKETRRITQATAKQVLRKMYETGEDAIDIIERGNLWMISDEELKRVVDKVIQDNPKAVADYKR